MEMNDKKHGATSPTISWSFNSWSKSPHSKPRKSLDISGANTNTDTTFGDESLFSIKEVDLKTEDEKGYPRTMFQEARIYKKVGAEMISTFVLVFTGCGAIMVDTRYKALTHVGVCAAFGIAAMAMLYTVRHISGGHMNPAVSIAFSSVGQLPWKELPIYVAAQTVGATMAAAALKYILRNACSISAAATIPEHAFQSLVLEFILTFILMLVLSAMVTDLKAVNSLIGVAVGGTIAMNALFAGPVSGASMNPARSLGAALVSGKYDGLWVYVSGPTLGAVCGAWAYRAIQLND